MEYFISKVYEVHATNNKVSELQGYLREYKNVLIESDQALEELKKEITEKVEELNVKYKRTKPLCVFMHKNRCIDIFNILISPDGRSDMVVASLTGSVIKCHYNGK